MIDWARNCYGRRLFAAFNVADACANLVDYKITARRYGYYRLVYTCSEETSMDSRRRPQPCSSSADAGFEDP